MSVNPFLWRGPEFLGFYFVLAAAALLTIYCLREWRERGEEQPQMQNVNPYVLAYLRGGKTAAVQTAVVSLVDRGLLEVKDDRVAAKRTAGAGLVRDALELAALNACASASGKTMTELMAVNLDSQMRLLALVLETRGLIPDAGMKALRSRDAIAAGVFLGAVAALKILIALLTGHKNIEFLAFGAFIALVLCFKIATRRVTRKGETFLESIRTLCTGLRTNAPDLRARRDTADLVLLASVFGLGLVPAAAFPHKERLFPQPASASGDSGSSSSDGGSSCGGGGCGGGCGGCGS